MECSWSVMYLRGWAGTALWAWPGAAVAVPLPHDVTMFVGGSVEALSVTSKAEKIRTK